MDTLKRLSIEADGICGAITNYSGEPHITNVTEQLKQSVGEQDIETIQFLLNELKLWFSNNQSGIQYNNFVTNKKMYLGLEQKINNYLIEFENYNNETTVLIPQKEGTNNTSKKIFISHSSKDKTICDAFIDLLEGIGLSENVILYSSSPRHGIPGDMDIFEYLRSHLDGGINVYYMLSDNYYQSVYCLNEMGAAWVKQNDSSTFLLPNFTKSIEGVIDNKKKAFTLNNPIDLVYLKNKLIAEFKIEVSEAKWEEIKNKFLNIVNAELEKFKGMQQLESLQKTEQAYAAEQEIRDKILHELEIEKVQVTIDKQAELYEKNAQIDVTKQVFEQILAGNTDVLKNLEQISKPQKQGYKISTHPGNKKKRR